MIKVRKWLLASVVVLVLGLAWRYPLLGFVVPVVVVSGLGTSIFRGRYFCGNGCPRGAFLDSLPVPVKRWKRLPTLFKNPWFRWTVVVVLFSLMIGRGLQHPASLAHWGTLFWQMCLVTTIAALLLAVFYRPRAWCAVCPVGTLQEALGGHRYQYRIAETCTGCGLCEKNCPLSLSIATPHAPGIIDASDCLKCGRCLTLCPAGAIEKPPEGKK